MSLFLSKSAPLELLIEILEWSETPADVLNFALTCRRMRDAWSTGQTGLRVAWTLLQCDIPAAELALITVRASKLAADGLANGEPSLTKVPLSTLGSGSRRPDSTELKAVRRLHSLVVSFEVRFCRDNCLFSGYDNQTRNLPEATELMDQWTCSMHRALYRCFTVSASLVSVYSEPYLACAESTVVEPKKTDEFRSLSEARQIASLRQFAPYNPKLDAEADHAAFGHVGDWLLSDILADTELRAHMKQNFDLTMGRGKSCDGRRRRHLESEDEDEDELALEPGPCPVQLSGYSHADAHSVALEVMRMFWASRNITISLDLYCEPDPEMELLVDSYGPIIPWGYFEVANIGFTSPVANPSVFFTPAIWPEEITTRNKNQRSIEFLLLFAGREHEESYRVRDQHIHPPPLQDKFFEYFLHHHLQSAFHPLLFQDRYTYDVFDDWDKFVEILNIFASDEVPHRATYYPGGGQFDLAGFLDGADLLVDSGPLRAQIARLDRDEPNQ